MNEDTVCLLKECDAGTKTAVNSIKEVLDNVQSAELMEILTASLKEHEHLGDELHGILDETGKSGKEPAPMARAMSWMKINFKMLTSPDDTTIASLILDGCNMGVKQLNEYLNKYRNADTRSRQITEKLIRSEERLGDKMKPFL